MNYIYNKDSLNIVNALRIILVIFIIVIVVLSFLLGGSGTSILGNVKDTISLPFNPLAWEFIPWFGTVMLFTAILVGGTLLGAGIADMGGLSK